MSGGPISAPEGWTPAQLLAAGWREDDLEWENASERAMAALAGGDLDRARAETAHAVRIAAAAFAADDPRLGTSLANHGAGLIAAGEGHLSSRTVADALGAWRNADGWIAKMTAPRAARSSLFHMRMEQRHRAAYEARRRAQWMALATEARGRIEGPAPLALISAEEAGARLLRWRRERPAELSDPRKLIAAVILLACRRG